ncbi:LuxR family transcriptional regulator [Mesorhizobium sp. M0622]|uniref:helix-turn-helix transcriptional regulator n=1 Tax=Mesorhizobium sp. M0622 TaxID=2956975 RepID=UPI0033382586
MPADGYGISTGKPGTKPSGQFPFEAPTDFPLASREALAVEFGRFVNKADDLVDSERLFYLLADFASSFGCRWIAYSCLTPDRESLSAVSRDPAAFLHFPQRWQERYAEMGYDRIDPVVKISRKREGAFRWSEVYNDASTSEKERKVLDEAATFGLRSAVSVPLHGPYASFAILSFAQPRECEFQNETVAYLQFSALHFHLKITELGRPKESDTGIHLSSREKECLLWTARGKSSWETGMILGISANTVNFHIKNIMRKLDAASRTVAAVKAIRLGLIVL